MVQRMNLTSSFGNQQEQISKNGIMSLNEFIIQDIIHEEDETNTFVNEFGDRVSLLTEIFSNKIDETQLCVNCQQYPAKNLCHYTGEAFCSECFHGQTHIIPGRVLTMGDFTEKPVAGKYIDELKNLWNKYPVKLTPQLIRNCPLLRRYCKVKYQYLQLCRIVLSTSSETNLVVSSNSSSSNDIVGDFSVTNLLHASSEPSSSTTLNMMRNSEGNLYLPLSCRHDQPFEEFEKLQWLRHDNDTFTMAELYNVAHGCGFLNSMETACKMVYKSLETCCLTVRRRSIGDRCEKQVQCHECQSMEHQSRRGSLPARKTKLSLRADTPQSSEDDASDFFPSPVRCTGGITSRQVVAAKMQRSDRANSWLNRCSDFSDYFRATWQGVQVRTLDEFRQMKAQNGMTKRIIR